MYETDIILPCSAIGLGGAVAPLPSYSPVTFKASRKCPHMLCRSFFTLDRSGKDVLFVHIKTLTFDPAGRTLYLFLVFPGKDAYMTWFCLNLFCLIWTCFCFYWLLLFFSLDRPNVSLLRILQQVSTRIVLWRYTYDWVYHLIETSNDLLRVEVVTVYKPTTVSPLLTCINLTLLQKNITDGFSCSSICRAFWTDTVGYPNEHISELPQCRPDHAWMHWALLPVYRETGSTPSFNHSKSHPCLGPRSPY